MAAGDLTQRIDVTSRDETVQLLQALANMNDSLARTVGKVRFGSDTISTASNEFATGNMDLSSRNLAQRSAAAAKEIKELIGRSVDTVEEGARLVG